MASELASFPREAFDRLTGAERGAWLESLETALAARLAGAESHWRFFEITGEVVKELKQAGHDLWLLDYDGTAIEQWGGDYMRPKGLGYILIEFEWPGRVRATWCTWDNAEPSASE